MTDIEKLEDILHRERMAKPLPEFDGQTQDEWNEEYEKIIDSLPFGDFKGNITEYGKKIEPMLELKRLEFQEALLDNAQNMLFWWSLYPFAILIFLCWVLNWG